MLIQKQPLLPKGTNNHSKTQSYFLSSLVATFSKFIFTQTFNVHNACEKGNFEVLKKFIDSYSDKQELKKILNRQDNVYGDHGNPPLYYAVRHSHPDCAQLLLEFGANANFKPLGPSDSILHIAALYSDVSMIALLLKHDANPNVLDERRKTPQHYSPEAFNEAKKLRGTDLNFVHSSTFKKDL